MGAVAETFAQLDKLEEENRNLRKALDRAAEFMSARCERCPFDGNDDDFGCTRPASAANCKSAVGIYLRGVCGNAKF